LHNPHRSHSSRISAPARQRKAALTGRLLSFRSSSQIWAELHEKAFRRLGVIPDAGTAYLLTRAVGRVRAMEMMMLAEKLPAQTALDWGLVNRVVAKEELESASIGLATDLASGPTRALAEIRKSCWHALEADFPAQLARDRIVQRAMGHTADHREGIAAFFDKRPAVFTGN